MRRRKRRSAGQFAAVSILALIAAFSPACAKIDTTRTPAPRGTTGEEFYGVLCDRVAAQALREDLSGASFHDVCHKNASGEYADQVDESQLAAPREGAVDIRGKVVPIEEQEANRKYALDRVHALVKRRADLIEAFDATFPDVEVPTTDLKNPDPAKSCDKPAAESKAISTLGRELADMLGKMGPLYNDGTIPNSTKSLARLIDVFATSKEAQETMLRFSQRKGYRPADVALGVIRPTLAYPHLRDLSAETLRLILADSKPFDPDPPRRADGSRIPVPGAAYEPLSAALAAAREELRTTKVEKASPPLVVTPDPMARRDLLSRPRDNLEILRSVVFAQDPSFGAGAARYIVKRDNRGLAAVPLISGAVPAPFVDANGDKLPDVDDNGVFVTQGGKAAPTPFFSVDAPDAGGTRDPFGRLVAGNIPVYDYIDTSHVFMTKLMTDTRALFDPDPEREAMMHAVGGIYVMMGAREGDGKTTKTYDPDPRAEDIWRLTHSAGNPPPSDINDKPVVLKYNGYGTESSPLLDLVYALGQLLSDHNIDDVLLFSRELMTAHTADIARLTGALLAFRDVANKHPEAKNAHAPTSTFWDEMIDVLEEIAKEPGLLEDLLRALGDDATLPIKNIYSSYLKFNDRISYNRSDVNGPAYNLTTKKTAPMSTPVDRSKPDSGFDRSGFHRFLQAVHDTKGVTACNKPGAILHADGMPVIGSADLCYSTVRANSICNFSNRPFKECEVFKIEKLANFYLASVIGEARLTFRPIVLRDGIEGNAGATVDTMQKSSGLTGFWDPPDAVIFRPKPQWLNRLVFFDLKNDTKNAKTNKFLKDLQGMHIPTSVCPERVIDDPIAGNDDFYQGDVSPDKKIHGLRTCEEGDNLDERDADSTFVWEQFGFFEAMTPILRVFFNHKKDDLLIEIVDIAYRHWQSDQGASNECDPNPGSSHYCAQDGLSSYEPLLAEGLAGDILVALHDLKKMLETVSIPRCTAVDANKKCTSVTNVNGITLCAEAVRALLDTDRARLAGLSDRHGKSTGKRNDGSATPYLTPIYLLTQALNNIDAAFAQDAKDHPDSKDRQLNWQKARSQLVDQFFKVKGSGPGSQFVNPAIVKITPVVIDLLRSQLYAHCPESFVPPYKTRCAWSRDKLTKSVAESLHGPVAAGLMDVMDAIRKDEPARRELESLMSYMLDDASKNQQLPTVLASMSDLMQLLTNDEDTVPMYHIMAEAAGGNLVDSNGKVVQRSLLDAQGALLASTSQRIFDKAGKELCSREVDPNQVLSIALKNLVTPLPGGTATEPRKSPLEVIMDVITEVNRVDPEKTDRLDAEDYKSISNQVTEFLLDKERGLEQLYEIMRNGTQ
jgi:hypothetical protein